MTEDEAKTKWCPMVRQINHVGENGGNRVGIDYNNMMIHHSLCIASECMWFKWTPDYEIGVAKGMVAFIDIDDAHFDDNNTWRWDGRYVKNANHEYLHRAITEKHFGSIPTDLVIDHIDGNPLNNRLGNLRLCTPSQNSANAKTRGGKSQYRGVFQARSGKWVAQITSKGKTFCIGTFDLEIDAAKAWDKKAEEIHGEYARLNLSSKENIGRQGHCGAIK